MVCKNTPPRKGNMVDCFRLNKENRNRILKGELTFSGRFAGWVIQNLEGGYGHASA